MQLLYVYIGGYIKVDQGPYKDEVSNQAYTVLNDIELNFSNKFIFDFDREKSILDVKKNADYINNFFDDEGRIHSISAIIGKNGTGKTSIIELIKWLQPDNLYDIPYKLILVYGSIIEETDQNFTILKQIELECELSEKLKNSKIQDFYSKNFGAFNSLPACHLSNSMDSITQIYYSPILEVQFSNLQAKYEVYGDTNLIDISSSKLIEKDAEYSINGSSQNLNSREVLVRHKMADVERQFNLVSESHEFEKLLGFKKPAVIELIIDASDIRFLQSSEIIENFNNTFPKVDVLSNHHPQNYFCLHLLKHSLYNLFRTLQSNSVLEQPENVIQQITQAMPVIEEKIDLKSWIIAFKENCSQIKSYNKDRLLKRFELVLKFFTLTEIDKKFRYADNTRCRLDLEIDIDKQIVEDYFEIKDLTGFLHLDWKFNLHNNGQLSSGEKSKFNLFSRFHSVKKNASLLNKDLSNLIILLDEGDTLFHPEWQRTYLNDFLNGIKIIFKDSKSIQIIMTTHSPFVSSDLPGYSVIKLDKDPESGFTCVDYNNSVPNFAANIHDLFADSFYMENGFVGEFARNKIIKLFDRISTMTKFDNPEEIKKEIDLIGEPFVKNSLNKHFQVQLKDYE